MYTKDQVEPLLDLVAALANTADNAGCSADLTVVDAAALRKVKAAAEALRETNQRLLVGEHSHHHGMSLYAFLVADGVNFRNADFEAWLEDVFMRDCDESACVHVIGTDDVEVIPK